MYSCVEDKLFYAQRGRGAFLNGEPLHASGQEGDITHTCDITHTHIGGIGFVLTVLCPLIRRQQVCGGDGDWGGAR